jgi:hypothetical protein
MIITAAYRTTGLKIGRLFHGMRRKGARSSAIAELITVFGITRSRETFGNGFRVLGSGFWVQGPEVKSFRRFQVVGCWAWLLVSGCLMGRVCCAHIEWIGSSKKMKPF